MSDRQWIDRAHEKKIDVMVRQNRSWPKAFGGLTRKLMWENRFHPRAQNLVCNAGLDWNQIYTIEKTYRHKIIWANLRDTFPRELLRIVCGYDFDKDGWRAKCGEQNLCLFHRREALKWREWEARLAAGRNRALYRN